MTRRTMKLKLLKWFDPRNRQMGTWGFIINRITALGLSFYLVLHMVMLYKLNQGPEAYNQFIELAKTPLIKIGELFVIAGAVFHGLNGIRIALINFGIGIRHQKVLLVTLTIFSFIIIFFFFYKMFIFE